MNGDFLDRLYSQYQDFFDEIDFRMEQEFSDDFDMLDEPSEDELAMMDISALQLLQDFLGE